MRPTRRVYVDVAGPERDFFLGIEGVDPEKAGTRECTAVVPEEDHCPGLVRLQDHEADKKYWGNDEEEYG